MTHATRIALLISALVVIVVAAIAGAYLLTAWQINRADQQWCNVINLLISHPVPKPADPAANPSRVQTYELYEDFVTVQHQFRCTK
jgi:hypothetical protein